MRPVGIDLCHVEADGAVQPLFHQIEGRRLADALLLGGGLNNLYDRYTKGHVVDYFHLNFGPKWLRAIVFNISDFCIFIGALLAVAGSEVS